MHMRFSSLTDQKCADWSAYWLFLNYRPLDKFRYTAGGIAKYGAKKSIFVNIDSYVDNTLSIIDMDFLYR